MDKKDKDKDTKYYYDEQSANLAIKFFERMLVQSTGEWAGQPLELLDWQKERIIKPLFGWKRTVDGTRRYRTVYIEIPRKQGKSTLASGLALLFLLLDNEPRAEVYSAAGDKEQARIVFDMAKLMVESSPYLKNKAEVFKNTITVPETNSFYKVLSADAGTKHGFNAHAVIFDELHVQPNRDLWDVLTTSTGARRQPVVVALTTAGFDRNSICWEMHEYGRQVEDGIIEDDTFLSVIYSADESDDWLDEEVWKKANPSLGTTVKLDYLRTQANMAVNSPASQNTFRRLHLNQWTQQDTRWLNMVDWDECGKRIIDTELLKGAKCYGGLDLASTNDIASLVLLFPNDKDDDESYAVLPYFWIPEENLTDRVRKDRVPYDVWVRDGFIRTTPGNVIDYNFILRDIEELGETYNILEIAFDRWGAHQVSQTLSGMGFELIGFGQGFKDMSPPTTQLMRLVLDGKLFHLNNPVLRWMADNMVVSTDPAGNVKPNKQKARQKIDGIVALIQALDRAIRHGGDKPKSAYESRGLLVI